MTEARSAPINRGAAYRVLWSVAAPGTDPLDLEEALDALEACVQPAQPQGIDRDGLVTLLLDVLRGTVVPAVPLADRIVTLLRPDPPQGIDRNVLIDDLNFSRFMSISDRADRILALLRPVDGVVLTPEEAQRVLTWRSVHGWPYDDVDDALAGRLEGTL